MIVSQFDTQFIHAGGIAIDINTNSDSLRCFYDDNGQETERYLMPGNNTPAIHIPKGQNHQLRSLQSGTVVF